MTTLPRAAVDTQNWRNIQMLRAVGALLVLFHHASAQYDAMGGISTVFKALSAGAGFAGVDIFFVISGFVAALTTFAKPRTGANAWAFMRRRLLRIYLGYWPFFALMVVLLWKLQPQVLAGMDLMHSFLLTSIELPRLVLYVSWSLSCELVFYLLVTLSFVAPTPVRIAVAWVTLAALVLWMYVRLAQPFAIFPMFLAEFLAGVLLYAYRDALRSRWWMALCGALAVAGFGAGYLMHATDGSWRVFTFGSGAVGLVMLAVLLERSKTWSAGRWAVALGDASYTLYLSHLPLLIGFYATGLRGYLALQPPVWRELGFGLFVVACMALSWLLYRVLELPLYRWATRSRKDFLPTGVQNMTIR